jgi:hypothetical protein
MNYSSMPGYGDLSGDSRNPNSPDYIEPNFGRDDAAGNVANDLVKNDGVGELIEDVASAASFLAWVGREMVIPPYLRQSWLNLERHAKMLNSQIDEEYEYLNRSGDQ